MFATWDLAAEQISENLAKGETSIDIDNLRGHSEANCKNHSGFITGLDCSPNLRRCRGLLVKMDHMVALRPKLPSGVVVQM